MDDMAQIGISFIPWKPIFQDILSRFSSLFQQMVVIDRR